MLSDGHILILALYRLGDYHYSAEYEWLDELFSAKYKFE